MSEPGPIGATYRLQLEPGFGFAAARAIVPYLQRLGITHIYVSPVLAAQPGSRHGYDVVDHARINPELGGREELEALAAALRERGMGLIVDFVPNHMGIAGTANAWWRDVLENGQASLFASHFDIDWTPPKTSLAGRVLLPVLADQYGEALESGELRIHCESGALEIEYRDQRFPMAADSLLPLLDETVTDLARPAGDVAAQELASIVTALRHLPGRNETDLERRTERAREGEVQKRRLIALCAADPEVDAVLQRVVTRTNGTSGDPRSFDRLDALLSDQAYRLCSWRVAAEQINYRRFFDVNALAALRMEDAPVFAAAHALLLDLIATGTIQGVRLDHVDGLYDPRAYLEELHQSVDAARRERGATDRPDGRPLPVYVEKILARDEHLPSWPVDGTTGYDFLGCVAGLWIDPRAAMALQSLWRRFTGDRRSYADVVRDSKRLVVTTLLAGEMHVLSRALERIADAGRRSRDFTLMSLNTAIVETLVALPAYRCYVRPDGSREPQDDAYIGKAIRSASRARPEISRTVFDFLRDVLRLDARFVDPEQRSRVVQFTMRFQQLSGSVMAKAVEDTAFYRFARLLSGNEVGADPNRFTTPVADFHASAAERRQLWPRTMNAGSTHDSKRGEDARARLAVLSEMPDEWRRTVRSWSRIARGYKTELDGVLAPSRRDEYLFYQTVLALVPPGFTADDAPGFESRLVAFMDKAIKEAKEDSSWVNPNLEYEAAAQGFVTRVWADRRFLADVVRFGEQIAIPAATNALAEVLLRCTCPGVPDFYRGAELWHQDLVDPDNRRPVDFESRAQALACIDAPGVSAAEFRDRFTDGGIKLHVIHTVLRCRARFPEVFARGSYRPIEGGEHLVAFERRDAERAVVVVVPRLTIGLLQGRRGWPIGDVWEDRHIEIPRGTYVEEITGTPRTSDGALRVAEVLQDLPVALLRRRG